MATSALAALRMEQRRFEEARQLREEAWEMLHDLGLTFMYAAHRGAIGGLPGLRVAELDDLVERLRDSYALLEGGEVLLRGLQIMPYSHTSDRAIDPMRDRKLLLNREEIRKLSVKINEKGMTLVALKVYFTERGIAKVELGLAKGKRLYDKREAIAERDSRRDVDRAMKRARQGD